MKLTFKSAESRRVYTHLTLLGFDKAWIKQVLLLIHRWEANNGKEWVVGRLKDLKVWKLQHLAGNLDYKPDWQSFKLSGNACIPKGPFSLLFKDPFIKTEKEIIRALSALMVYTGYKLTKVSPKQIRKTLGSINQSKPSEQDNNQWASIGLAYAQPVVADPGVTMFHRKKSKGFRFNPVSLNTGKPFTTSGERYLRSFVNGCRLTPVRKYLEANFGMPVEDFSIDIESYSEGAEEFMPLSGQISLIQERGAKARVVAMPHSSAQVALYPLHRALDEVLRNLSSDCTHDQEEGARWAQKKLLNGHVVHSVDLSGATDNFPLSFQLGILEGLNLREEADLFKELSQGLWQLAPSLRDEANRQGFLDAISYTKGQGQGIYASFPLFALSHNLLVKGLARGLGLDDENTFRVLGDDIVIADDALHDEYRRTLSLLGVPISEEKSISSHNLAEFAGFVITSDGYWKPAKVPNPSGNTFGYDNNFVNYLRVVGHKGLKQLPSKVRRVATKVAELPTELGGLGFNPNGKSYDERVKDFIMTDKDLHIPTYMSMEKLFTQLNLSDRNYDQSELTILEWLYDQYSIIQRDSLKIFDSAPKTLRNLVDSLSTNPSMLAYQYSALLSIADVPDGSILVGNTAEITSGYVTELVQWGRRFRDLDGPYKDTNDSSNDDTLKQGDKVRSSQERTSVKHSGPRLG